MLFLLVHKCETVDCSFSLVYRYTAPKVSFFCQINLSGASQVESISFFESLTLSFEGNILQIPQIGDVGVVFDKYLFSVILSDSYLDSTIFSGRRPLKLRMLNIWIIMVRVVRSWRLYDVPAASVSGRSLMGHANYLNKIMNYICNKFLLI